MTAGEADAAAVAAALQLAEEDRWKPPAPAPLPRLGSLIPDYSSAAPPAVAASVLYVSPRSTRRVRRRPRPRKRT